LSKRRSRLRHARRERDTWCGSSTDRRPVEQAGVDFAGAKSTNRGLPQQSSTTWRSFATKRPHRRLAAGAQLQAAVSEGLTAMKAGARQPQRCAGDGDQAAAGARAATASIRPPSLSAGGPSNAATFFLSSMIVRRAPTAAQPEFSRRESAVRRQRVWSAVFGPRLAGLAVEGARGALTPPVRHADE